MKGERMLPPTYLYLSIVIMAVLHFLFPVVKVIPFPWNLLGAVPLALGVVINILADSAFKKQETTVKPFEESKTLIMSGVFRISRHPMYIGFVLILIGLAVLMGTLTPYLVIVVFAFLMDFIFIRGEERMLEETFGENWLKYKKKVRRWI
ncbi:hypothetical protein CH333_06460 [candidate division WOR-3 bacterium JGI_Cruoil_03_44_89]|uniref:Steroid 5-alpha reductase C-terminal domain-containing protein n=1 Tax=candidate division WOR-3 bacterium JGI_Cruoil_03_44_89 TaxID=1973748 RepID=A0A235BSG8_UNCW3|nr:MAG: hypothetical protein CH333_06460 [candidate division WOR-3 bacterium JGI_Cruoil_03_44_89]